MKQFKNPTTVHKPLAGYSHQAELSPTEKTLVLSGQIGMTIEGDLPESPLDQFKIALENVRLNLEAAKMEIKDIVKLTIFAVGDMDAGERRKILSDFLKGHEPCMTFLFVAALATPAIKIEVEALAGKE